MHCTTEFYGALVNSGKKLNQDRFGEEVLINSKKPTFEQIDQEEHNDSYTFQIIIIIIIIIEIERISYIFLFLF